MKRFAILLASVSLACGLAGAQTYTNRGSGGYGAKSAYHVAYNQGSVIDFKGRVIGVQRSSPMEGVGPSYSMLVKTPNGGTAMVDLGPAWYMDGQKRQFKVGDRVEVQGSKIFIEGKSMILARKVVHDNQVLYLRAEDGWPMWIAYRAHVTVGNAQPAPQNVVINGSIVELTAIPNGQAGVPSAVVVVRDANNRLYNVDLGPLWFIERQDMLLQVGNIIVLTGSPWRNNYFTAVDLRYGTDMWTFRYPDGRPVWVGFGGGR